MLKNLGSISLLTKSSLEEFSRFICAEDRIGASFDKTNLMSNAIRSIEKQHITNYSLFNGGVTMATVSFRMDDTLKRQAEAILEELGLNI